MEKDKFLIIAIVFLFVLNLFTLGFILFDKKQPPPPMREGNEKMMPPGDFPDGKPEKPDKFIIEKLKFNEEQVQKFEELKKEHRRQIEDIQFQSRKLHDEYFGLLKSETVDSVKAAQILDQISANQKELDKVTFSHFAKIKEICKGEQKELFNRVIEDISKPLKEQRPPR